MTTRTSLGTIASTVALTASTAGLILLLIISGGVLRGRDPVRRAGVDRPATASSRPAAEATTSATPAARVRVSIDNFSYSPAELTITVGTNVTWLNHDDVPHTVTANDKTFNSGALDTDDTYSRVFDKPGEYAYFCGLHPHMTGRVIVK